MRSGTAQINVWVSEQINPLALKETQSEASMCPKVLSLWKRVVLTTYCENNSPDKSLMLQSPRLTAMFLCVAYLHKCDTGPEVGADFVRGYEKFQITADIFMKAKTHKFVLLTFHEWCPISIKAGWVDEWMMNDWTGALISQELPREKLHWNFFCIISFTWKVRYLILLSCLVVRHFAVCFPFKRCIAHHL